NAGAEQLLIPLPDLGAPRPWSANISCRSNRSAPPWRMPPTSRRTSFQHQSATFVYGGVGDLSAIAVEHVRVNEPAGRRFTQIPDVLARVGSSLSVSPRAGDAQRIGASLVPDWPLIQHRP